MSADLNCLNNIGSKLHSTRVKNENYTQHEWRWKLHSTRVKNENYTQHEWINDDKSMTINHSQSIDDWNISNTLPETTLKTSEDYVTTL